jgi:16S rRNA (cytidine1402-2'-O)-methyltransferase
MPHEYGYNRADLEQGILYVVATSIGNANDLTLRARRVLNEADAVICEERRAGSTLLAQLKITKPLFEFNEHSTPGDADGLCERLRAGESLALISDHGTPLIQDPGAPLVAAALRRARRRFLRRWSRAASRRRAFVLSDCCRQNARNAQLH